jgi:hypothetical protein
MDGLGEKVFAGSCFSGDQDMRRGRGIGGFEPGESADHSLGLFDFRAFADDSV